jgi:hypothetical protein
LDDELLTHPTSRLSGIADSRVDATTRPPLTVRGRHDHDHDHDHDHADSIRLGERDRADSGRGGGGGRGGGRASPVAVKPIPDSLLVG